MFTLAQVGDDRGAYPLLMCEVVGNTVQWPGKGLLLELGEGNPGLLRDLVFGDNICTPVPRRDQMRLPRGGRHFVDRIDRRDEPVMKDV